MSEEEEQSLIYYPNPPIPLDKGFSNVIINELNFIEPFAPPIFEPLTSDEENEFEEILRGIKGEVNIPTCQNPHTPPEFEYIHKLHLDGYPIEYETLEDDGAEFEIDPVTGQIGNVKHDKLIHKLYEGCDSDSNGEELQKKAESEAKARAEEALRKAEEAKKKAEEARRLAEEERRKRKEEEERLRKEEEERKRKREEEKRKREEERKRKREEERKRKEAEEKAAKPTSPENLPPVLRNRFKNLNIINPGGAPTTMSHMKRIIQSSKANEATVNRPQG